MKIITQFFKDLLEFIKQGLIDEIDVAIIISMFRLHPDLPNIETALYKSGFFLTKNDRKRFGGSNAIWEKNSKIVKHSEIFHETMFNRTDSHRENIEYIVNEDIIVRYQYINSERDYGRIKIHEYRCTLTKRDEELINYVYTYS